MGKFAIRPRRYYDRCDAIDDVLIAYMEKGGVIDQGLNPNSKYSLLQWAVEEIRRLREVCGEKPPEKRTRIIVGPRPVAESKPITIEEA